ncbi:MAG: MFS transporter [Lachnospiraceae bacterium]|nr:MFS transporter [Lachnospiraceae bacterium]
MNTNQPARSLWTKDFTIITLGSAVSMVGNAMCGFALSLLVLDYTKSTFLYAIYLAAYTLPQIIVPVFSGAVLDRFSRKKTIYTLDFISAVLYAFAAYVLHLEWFNFPILAVFCFIVGTINSIYTVAYQSFYPLLITEGNYSKAYSISSFLETVSMIMIPVATFAYNILGMTPLFTLNAVSFLCAAIMETQISAKEDYIKLQQQNRIASGSFKSQMFADLKEGLEYLKQEKGLQAVTYYFTIASVAYGVSSVITLPYFKETYPNGEYVYIMVWGMSVLGRGLGSLIHYKFKYPARHKYNIAIVVYVITALAEGVYLYLNVPVMMAVFFVVGILGVTSYTIRISATQNYVPDEKKGRFNGAFNMLNTGGHLLGELVAGILTIKFAPRTVLTGFMMISALFALIIIGGNKKAVSDVYNREL